MGYGYRVRPVRDAYEWGEYFDTVQRPHLMQSHAYGEAKRQAEHWHINRCVFERSGTPVAICQVLEKRLAGLRVASRINRGPLFLEVSPPYEVKENVLRLVREHWKLFRGGPLLIAPALEATEENRDMLVRLGYRNWKTNGWCSSVVDLQQEENEMRKRLTSAWRNNLKSSLKKGLELRLSNSDETREWMLERHAENMMAKNFKGPRQALLRALHKTKPADFLVLQAVFEDRPVAGLVLARYGQIAEYYVGWFGDVGRKLKCGNFLYWHAALEAKKAGHQWFDVGGYYSSDKFGHFKQGMRGIEYKLVGEWLCF